MAIEGTLLNINYVWTFLFDLNPSTSTVIFVLALVQLDIGFPDVVFFNGTFVVITQNIVHNIFYS